MISALIAMPIWLSAFLLVGVTTGIAMAGPWLVRRWIGLENLATNNEVAGFKFATVGVLYAVLLAFATIVVWEKFSFAESTVAQEAAAAANIYRLSHLGDATSGERVRAALDTYLDLSIKDDWVAMERGATSPRSLKALDAVYDSLRVTDGIAPGDLAARGELLRQLDVLTQARRVRLSSAQGSVPGVLWFALFGGAVATITFTFFFGTRNLRAQTMMTGILSFLIFAELLIIVTIDRPFAGSVKVAPEALEVVLADFGPKPVGVQHVVAR